MLGTSPWRDGIRTRVPCGAISERMLRSSHCASKQGKSAIESLEQRSQALIVPRR